MTDAKLALGRLQESKSADTLKQDLAYGLKGWIAMNMLLAIVFAAPCVMFVVMLRERIAFIRRASRVTGFVTSIRVGRTDCDPLYDGFLLTVEYVADDGVALKTVEFGPMHPAPELNTSLELLVVEGEAPRPWGSTVFEVAVFALFLAVFLAGSVWMVVAF